MSCENSDLWGSVFSGPPKVLYQNGCTTLSFNLNQLGYQNFGHSDEKEEQTFCSRAISVFEFIDF